MSLVIEHMDDEEATHTQHIQHTHTTTPPTTTTTPHIRQPIQKVDLDEELEMTLDEVAASLLADFGGSDSDASLEENPSPERPWNSGDEAYEDSLKISDTESEYVDDETIRDYIAQKAEPLPEKEESEKKPDDTPSHPTNPHPRG